MRMFIDCWIVWGNIIDVVVDDWKFLQEVDGLKYYSRETTSEHEMYQYNFIFYYCLIYLFANMYNF